MAKNFIAQMELRFSATDQQLDIVTLMFSKLRAEQVAWLATYRTHAVQDVLCSIGLEIRYLCVTSLIVVLECIADGLHSSRALTVSRRDFPSTMLSLVLLRA